MKKSHLKFVNITRKQTQKYSNFLKINKQMNQSQYKSTASNRIYGLRNLRPIKIYSNHEVSSRMNAVVPYSLGEIYQNNTSTILHDYEESLKSQLKSSKLKELQRKERKRLQTISVLREDKKESRIQQKKLVSELESIKYRLKTVGLENETGFRRRQRSIVLKSSLNNENKNPPLMPNISAPMYYPYYIPNPPNPYPPYPSYSMMPYDPIYIPPQNIHRNYSQPPRSNHRRKRATNPSQYEEDQSQQQKTIKKPKDMPKPEFNRDKFKKRINHYNGLLNKKQNMKKLRKCFLAVYFSVILKRSYQKIVKQRKNFFLQFWPQEFYKFENTFKEYFYSKFFPFFRLLKEKEYTSLIPTAQDTKALQLQKKKTLQELIKLFFQCLRPFKNIQNLGKIAWGFCSNGCFVQKGILTVNEIDFVNIHQTHGYLRMDSYLQKSQIIGFILIKMVLYNFLLHPWRKWQKQFSLSENRLLIENLKLIGSILYDLFLTLQDQYIKAADLKMYPIGNYNQVKLRNQRIDIQFQEALLYQTNKAGKQLISGLFTQQFLKKNVGFKRFLPYLQVAQQVVEGIYSLSRKYNKVFRSKVLKHTPKINYKY